ncbi:MAG: hypothetical protein FJX71_06335 [Alphaproteobacteria bacterium]|nr:hypothetical protein [Alphaproteobacteria bacterium]
MFASSYSQAQAPETEASAKEDEEKQPQFSEDMFEDHKYWATPPKFILTPQEPWEHIIQGLGVLIADKNMGVEALFKYAEEEKAENPAFLEALQTEKDLIMSAYRKISDLSFTEENAEVSEEFTRELYQALGEQNILGDVLDEIGLTKHLRAYKKKKELESKPSRHPTSYRILSTKNMVFVGILAACCLFAPAAAAPVPRPTLVSACDGPFYECLSSHADINNLVSTGISSTNATTLFSQPSYTSTVSCLLNTTTPGSCMPFVNAANNAGYYSELQTFEGRTGNPLDAEMTRYAPSTFPNLTGIDYAQWLADPSQHSETPFQVVGGVTTPGLRTLQPGNYYRYQAFIRPGDTNVFAIICNPVGDLCASTFIVRSPATQPRILRQGVLNSVTRASFPILPQSPQNFPLPVQGFPACTDYYSCLNAFNPALLNTINIATLDPVYRLATGFLSSRTADSLGAVPLGMFSANGYFKVWDFDARRWPNISVSSFASSTYPSTRVCTKIPDAPLQHQQICADVSPLGVQTNIATTFQPKSIFVPQRYLDPAGQHVRLVAISQGSSVMGQFITFDNDARLSNPNRVIWEGVWTPTAPTPSDYVQNPSSSTNKPSQATGFDSFTYDNFQTALSVADVLDPTYPASNCVKMPWNQWVGRYVATDPFYDYLKTCFSQRGVTYSDRCRSLMQESQGSYMRFNSFFRPNGSSVPTRYTIDGSSPGAASPSGSTLAPNAVVHLVERYQSPPAPGAVVLEVAQDLVTNAVTTSYKAILNIISNVQCPLKRSVDQLSYPNSSLSYDSYQASFMPPKMEFLSFKHYGALSFDNKFHLDPDMSISDWWRAIEQMRRENTIPACADFKFIIRTTGKKQTFLFRESEHGVGMTSTSQYTDDVIIEPIITFEKVEKR